MNYIEGYCFTNLDDYDCSLVKFFGAVPRVGEYVRVMYKGNVSRLKVVSVEHIQKDNKPHLRIELHK